MFPIGLTIFTDRCCYQGGIESLTMCFDFNKVIGEVAGREQLRRQRSSRFGVWNQSEEHARGIAFPVPFATTLRLRWATSGNR